MIEDFSIKMDDPKEPDDTRTWRGMDIYVFANGQQNSPPRKYHLESDQLEWWEITLAYLAGTQYGSIDPGIDLYTIDGKKIEGPLELRNDHAYVAVKKPDDFIDAGYYKYLVKATRSWEKSQSKRSSNNINNNNNNNDTIPTKDDIKPEIPPDGSNAKIIQSDERTKDNNFSLQMIAQRHSVESSTSVIKIGPAIVENRNENVNITDTKRSSLQAPIRRLSSQTTPSSTKKPTIKRRESVKLDNVPVNDKKVPHRYSSSLYPRDGIMSSKSKLYKVSNIKNSTLPTGLPKVNEDLNEQSTISDKQKSNSNDNNNVTSQNVAPNNTNELIVRLSDRVQEQPTLSDVIPIKNVESESIKEKVTEMHKDNKNFRIDSIATVSNKETVRHSENLSVVPTKNNEQVPINLEPTAKPSKFVNEVAGDKFFDKAVTATDKDDVVIKLHIDIWYHNKDPNQTVISASGPQYAISTEKEFQAKMQDERKSGTKCAETSMDVNSNDQSVIIIKCLSRSFHEESQFNTESSSKRLSNKSFIVFLPILQLDESKACHCPEGLESRQVKLSNVKYPVRRTTSCLSLLHTMSYFGSGEGLFDSSCANQPKDPRLSRDKSNIVKKKSGILHRDPVCSKLQCSPLIVNEPTNTEFVLIEQVNDIVLPVKTIEESTQTEWCNLMMEARLQSDGHYAFYLPSLETLKKYKLHVY